MKSLSSLLLAALLCLPAIATAEDAMTDDRFDARIAALFDWSKENRRGLSLHFDGAVLHGVVKEVLVDAVVLSNQERGTIVVRRDRIVAVEGQ